MAEFKLAPICRNIPDDLTLKTAVPPRPYRLFAAELDDVQPVRSNRELFNVKSVYISATNVRIGRPRKNYVRSKPLNMPHISNM